MGQPARPNGQGVLFAVTGGFLTMSRTLKRVFVGVAGAAFILVLALAAGSYWHKVSHAMTAPAATQEQLDVPKGGEERRAGQGPRLGLQGVLSFYCETAGAVFDGEWGAPPDPMLASMSVEQILGWLRARDLVLSKPRDRDPVLTYEASRISDLGRAAAALAQLRKGKEDDPGLLSAQVDVLQQTLDLMVSAGHAPLSCVTMRLQELSREHSQAEALRCLYVDLYRGLTSVAVGASTTYAVTAGLEDPASFTRSIKEEAEAVELKRLQALYAGTKEGKAADRAAIYIVQHLWPKNRVEAEALVRKHTQAWETDPGLCQRASRAIGDVLSGASLLAGFSFVDTSGRRWEVGDLSGQATLFCFVSKGYESLPAQWQKRYGERARVIAVPMFGARIQAAGFSVADPTPENTEAVARALHVVSLPTTILVTSDLRVMSDPGAIGTYLNSRDGSH